jgi:ABC-type dipeptide/oligopeptide/nickel transport system permease component
MGALRYLLMPALALCASPTALIARMMRSCMLDVLREDYIRTARSKGLKEPLVIFRHALKNAFLPVLTVVGLAFAALAGGAVVTETVFALPGVGRLVMTSVAQRDYPVIQGVLLLTAFLYVVINLFVDLCYAYLDPRITYG